MNNRGSRNFPGEVFASFIPRTGAERTLTLPFTETEAYRNSRYCGSAFWHLAPDPTLSKNVEPDPKRENKISMINSLDASNSLFWQLCFKKKINKSTFFFCKLCLLSVNLYKNATLEHWKILSSLIVWRKKMLATMLWCNSFDIYSHKHRVSLQMY